MIKKYVGARKEILAERDEHSQQVQWTKYATNKNYVFEGLKNDTPAIIRLRAANEF